MIASLVIGCIEAIEPEFDYQSGLIFIDAFALSEKGLSQVSIKQSIELSDFGSFENVSDAKVFFVNEANGEIEILSEISKGFYVPNENFSVMSEDTWKVKIDLADGRSYESLPQKVSEHVDLDELQATYSDELVFDPGYNDFVPGHKISATFSDPAVNENYYIWRTRTFEPLNTCLTCFNGILRGGECVFQEIARWLPKYHDYLCLSDCWLIRYGTNIAVFSDQFSDGNTVEGQEITDVIYYRKENVLVEIQQLSVGESTYKYYKTINDLVQESGGLNAPTPAALLGNLISTTNPEEIVVGNFTAASVSTKRIFIERTGFDYPADPDRFIHLESCIGCPTTYQCEEGENRTGIKPIGWVE